ncbi:SRPBCC family protein [Nocardia harenae]|uniref:SRPBCC family protein n=1 Tax=Nocardia harenae TaxID=358707 RepID=UPI000836A558|nr:SRPBCC family protein [Nocardia harenae]
MITDLEAATEVAAPLSTVWRTVSRLGRTPRWSPSCRFVLVLGGARPGAHAIHLNRDGARWWPTTSRIVEFVPGRRIAWRVNENRMRWSYTLAPTGSGTRITLRRDTGEGQSWLSAMLGTHVFGGQPAFDERLLKGMRETLRGLARELERPIALVLGEKSDVVVSEGNRGD